jgi:hypothetical protein
LTFAETTISALAAEREAAIRRYDEARGAELAVIKTEIAELTARLAAAPAETMADIRTKIGALNATIPNALASSSPTAGEVELARSIIADTAALNDVPGD